MTDYIYKVIPMQMGRVGFKHNKQFLDVYSYLIYTESGKVYLYDTGLNEMFVTAKDEILQDLGHFMEVEVKKEELLDEKLKQYKVEKNRLQGVICSHLHFDHAGGLPGFADTSVKLLMQRKEYEEAQNTVRSFEYKREDFGFLDKRDNLILLDGDISIDGNDMLQCVQTLGHSAGHQSLILMGRNKKMLLTGDAVYTTNQMVQGKLSSLPFRKQEAMDSLKRIQDMVADYDYVICGHDCEEYANQEIYL